MNIKPKTISNVVVVLGVLLVLYGFFVTVVTNEQEIKDFYNCDRTTEEVRETDKYCDDLKSAPQATTAFNWPVIVVGVMMVAIGSFVSGKYDADEEVDKQSKSQRQTKPEDLPPPPTPSD